MSATSGWRPVAATLGAALLLVSACAKSEDSDAGSTGGAPASAGAQVRESAALAAETDLSVLADEGRPRAVVVAGIGTAGLTGGRP